ncbi:hypothetical protein MKW92_051872 [Papaver armeniacum]|nr:hypothetical protein MKW92_051872 [Papaver armeniacum]
MVKKICTSLLLFLVLIISVESRFITFHSSDHTDDNLISDGISSDNNVEKSTRASFTRHSYYLPEGICEETYGFLPCTTTVFGNLFLIIIYGGLMLVAAKLLSTGSELLLEILGPGIVGGLFLPMLGALPDALLILVSGISGTKEVAQEQVLVGMGLLAGSTVMLLTLLWGSCIVLGKCDIEDSTAVDLKDTKRLSLMGSGVTVDIWTRYASWIMIISVVPFIIVQLPQILHINSGRHLVVLISLIVSVALLISYCVYQVFQPWIQRRKLAYAKHSHVISGILRHLDLVYRLTTDGYSPNVDVIKRIFRSLDLNEDGTLSVQELRALVIGIRFAEEIEFDEEEAVRKMLSEFDITRDGCIDETEFVKGILQWLDKAKPHGMIHRFYQHTKKEHDQLLDKSDECYNSPLPQEYTNFLHLPFIVSALSTNPNAKAALIFASRKKKRTGPIDITLRSVYLWAVTMNNILCLSVFLALVYGRGTVLGFLSFEVLVILIVCVVMGLFTSLHTTFLLDMSVLSMYPSFLSCWFCLSFL